MPAIPARGRTSTRQVGAGERFVSRPELVFALGTAFLVMFLLLAVLVPEQPLAVERHWNEWMQDIRGSFLTNVADFFNAIGRGLARAALIAAPGIVLLRARRRWALLAFAVTEAVTPLVSTVSKALVQRPRPSNGLVHPAGASFPSGHAAFAAATSIALVLLFTRVGRRRRRWWVLATLAMLAMDWSRTYLQVHWLLDVIGGTLLGAGVAFTVFAGFQLRRPPREAGGQ
jgi:membrane-associated phospholipid phosphatase